MLLSANSTFTPSGPWLSFSSITGSLSPSSFSTVRPASIASAIMMMRWLFCAMLERVFRLPLFLPPMKCE